MELYLVQHGESKSKDEDPERPLTNQGREKVGQVARKTAEAGIKVSRILHSDKLRAKQTAEIFAQHLSPTSGIEEVEGLAPLDDPEKAESLVESAEGALMLVGHLPHLSRLASTLILGEPEKEIIKFRMGGVVCLVCVEEGWRVSFALTPM